MSEIDYRLDVPPFSARVIDVAMAQVNLRHGFSVCGMRVEAARTQVLYSKSLGAES